MALGYTLQKLAVLDIKELNIEDFSAEEIKGATDELWENMNTLLADEGEIAIERIILHLWVVINQWRFRKEYLRTDRQKVAAELADYITFLVKLFHNRKLAIRREAQRNT